MNVVDSSGWLAFFADEKNAGQFLPILEDTASLVVPSITIYEVFKVILRESGENAALQASVAMQRGKVVDVDTGLAMKAAKLGLKHNLHGWQHHPGNSTNARCCPVDAGYGFQEHPWREVPAKEVAFSTVGF